MTSLDPELDSVELVISSNFHFVERGLMITGQPSLQEWGETWETIQFFDEDILPYVIGDMLAYGELTYGQAHAQFLKPNGQGRYTSGSLRNLKYVSSRWPLSRRRYAVPWSYYQETAGLAADKQDEVMQRLVAGGGKRNGLRSEIRQLNGGKAPNPPTNPDDTIEELRQENYRQEQRIAELESQLEQPIVSPEFDDSYSLPIDSVPEVDNLSQPVIGWLKQVGYSSVIIYQSGKIVIKP